MRLKNLSTFFPPKDIEWRIARSGINRNDEIWALAVAYVDNRAIMRRLDEVCGVQNWCNQYAPGPSGGVVCGIGIKIDDIFIFKWDGADNPKTEPVKGGLSNSMKRAAVQWGIGRYLYDLPETFVVVGEPGQYPNRGSFKVKNTNTYRKYSWKTPPIPKEFLPEGVEESVYESPRMNPDEEQEPQVLVITPEQRITLGEICESKNWNVPVALKRLAKKYNLEKIDQLPRDQFDEVAKYLDSFPPRGVS